MKNLSKQHSRIIWYLIANDLRAKTQKEICDALKIDKSGISKAMDDLKGKYIEETSSGYSLICDEKTEVFLNKNVRDLTTRLLSEEDFHNFFTERMSAIELISIILRSFEDVKNKHWGVVKNIKIKDLGKYLSKL